MKEENEERWPMKFTEQAREVVYRERKMGTEMCVCKGSGKRKCV